MKRYRAVALYVDKTWRAEGFDEKSDAERWLKSAEKDGELFWGFVMDYVRGDMSYDIDHPR